MIGQDAVKTSKAFHERLGLTGVVLTKLDGDARGGAALSVKEVTGAPVRFVGIGETLDKFEEFRADGMASRVLGMGDVVGLMKDFEEVVDEKDAAEKAMKMLEGQFTLDDFLEQIRMIQKMGSLKDLVAKMPGMGDMIPPGANLDDKRARPRRGDHPVADEVRAPRPLRPHPRALARDSASRRAPASPRRRCRSSCRSSSS